MIKNFAKLTLSICIVTVVAQFSVAQGFSIRLDPTDDGQKQFDDQFDLYRNRTLGRMKTVIEELRVECELNEQEHETLSSAISVAAEALIKADRREKQVSLRRNQRIAGFVIEDDQVVKGKTGKRPLRQLEFTINPLSAIEIEYSEAVEQAILASLTDAQIEKRKAVIIQKEKLFQQAAVDVFVARVDLVMLLNNQQYRRLREAILADELAVRLADNERYLETSRPRARVARRLNVKLEYTELVQGIFDEDQLEKWNGIFEPELAGLQQPKKLPTPRRR